MELSHLTEGLEANRVYRFYYKRIAYTPNGISESGVVGLLVSYGYRFDRLRDTLIPCMSSPGFEVTTPLPAVFDWYCTDNDRKLQPASSSETRSHYALSTDDLRVAEEQPSGVYAIDVSIRMAECSYRERLEVLAIPGTFDPFPKGAESFSYNTGNQYTVSHAWGGRDTWSWKLYSGLRANRIDPKTGVISGKVDTMCRITVGLVCEDCPDVEWKRK